MNVGMAEPGGFDADDQLSGIGSRYWPLLDHERLLELTNNSGFHGMLTSVRGRGVSVGDVDSRTVELGKIPISHRLNMVCPP
jgi:hypothetical protein